MAVLRVPRSVEKPSGVLLFGGVGERRAERGPYEVPWEWSAYVQVGRNTVLPIRFTVRSHVFYRDALFILQLPTLM